MEMSNLAKLVDQYMGVNPPAPHIYNCAESFIRACNDHYQLNLREESLRIFCSFGGGLNMGLDCGFYLAAIACIGILYGSQEAPYKNPKVVTMTQKWYEAFVKRFGTNMCSDLKDPIHGCGALGHQVGQLFEEFIEREGK